MGTDSSEVNAVFDPTKVIRWRYRSRSENIPEVGEVMVDQYGIEWEILHDQSEVLYVPAETYDELLRLYLEAINALAR
jgi:hypothetical protein